MIRKLEHCEPLVAIKIYVTFQTAYKIGAVYIFVGSILL
jgi:hypothetical protein